MGGLSLWHWLIVLVVVVLIFGTKRLRNLGQDLGESVKGFKKGMSDDDKPTARLSDDTRTDDVSASQAPHEREHDSGRDDPPAPR